MEELPVVLTFWDGPGCHGSARHLLSKAEWDALPDSFHVRTEKDCPRCGCRLSRSVKTRMLKCLDCRWEGDMPTKVYELAAKPSDPSPAG
jgi:ribosomal protein L37AE/L43A